MRERRIANEWTYLLTMAESNRGIVEIIGRQAEPVGDRFDFWLHRTPAYVSPSELRSSHALALRFPEYYPAVPCEAFLAEPVFHPNVHPVNGFICLWDRSSAGDSVIEAIQQIQRVVSWNLFNAAAEHVMQPKALACAESVQPLVFERVIVPDELARERAFRQPPVRTRRPRLSDPD